jgi:uncharacterized protein (TIGR00730 family)
MTIDASAYIYFPGGFGTLDELFELVVLEQTGRIPKAPIILVGSNFWQPIVKMLHEVLLNSYQTVSQKDIDLLEIYDDYDEIIARIDRYERKRNVS